MSIVEVLEFVFHERETHHHSLPEDALQCKELCKHRRIHSLDLVTQASRERYYTVGDSGPPTQVRASFFGFLYPKIRSLLPELQLGCADARRQFDFCKVRKLGRSKELLG
jgi:hypothetical protein